MTLTAPTDPAPQGGRPARASQLADFRAVCERLAGRSLTDPADLHAFSVHRAPLFWRAFLDWSGLPWSGSAETVVVGDDVETARFFPEVTLNYAEALLRPLPDVDDDSAALTAVHAGRRAEHYTRGQLRAAVRRTATALAGLGTGIGDCVAAIAPNNAEVLVGVLAATAIGATVSTATPDMGSSALLGRLGQTEPRLLLLDRSGMDDVTLAEVVAGLPTLHAVLLLDDAPPPAALPVAVHRLADLVAATGQADPVEWPRLPFEHPLFVMFSSGTTGPPKAMVHGAGGTLLEHVKEHRLHGDLRPDDTLYFHTTTAWMMWNWQLSALAVGAHVVVYDGPVLGPSTLWELAAEQRVTVLGTSPAYLQLCQDSGYRPAAAVDLSALRSVLSTGAVLHDWQFDWVSREVGPLPLQSISGGTDVIGCFLLGHPELPVRPGRCQTRSLGMDVVALGPDGEELLDGIGDLVCRRPFPSRPVGFLRDPDGARFHAAYFVDHPGHWTHGDLVEFASDGSARLHGRSDGVLNVNGVRIGPAEVHTALRELPAVAAALAVEQRDPAHPGASRMVLLVVLADGARLDDALERDIRRTLRRRASAAHVPSLVVAVPELPLTHNGKTSERAARDAVNGDAVGNLSALRNPGSLDAIRAAVLAVDTDPAGGGTAADGPEAAVTRLWETALGRGGSRPDDEFFDLGGTSRQVMTLLHRVREEVGVDVSLPDFFTRPTLGGLLDSVASARSSVAPGALMPLRTGHGAPLVLVVEGWRPLTDYAALVRHLRVECPVYALRPRLTDDAGRALSVGEVAGLAVEELRTVPSGAVAGLVGHGFGGLVALEVAHRVRQDGVPVGALVLVDAPWPAGALPPLVRAGRRWAGRLAALRSPDRGRDLWQRFVDRYAPATTSPERQEFLRARAAADGHRPSSHDGPVVSVVPQQRPRRIGDDTSGWRRTLPAGTVSVVAARSADLLEEPFVTEVAARVSTTVG
ncbi:acetoacetate--CoA ligase [Geodermatophilus sp. SYSU D00079]